MSETIRPEANVTTDVRRMDLGLTTRTVRVVDHEATGRLMRNARETCGVTLRELSRRMSCSAGYLSDLERGNRNWTQLKIERYANALGLR